MRNNFRIALLSTCCFSFCGTDSPTETTPTVTAPTIQSPSPGATVSTSEPTLRVENASGAQGLRYRFEVASDSGFQSLVATADDLPEGGTGTTEWRVSPQLNSGGSYFWRARASVEDIQGPYSSASSFEVVGGFSANTPVDQTYVYDPLINGTSVGEIGGGEFRAQGWMATDALSYIRYEIPTTPNGYVEFDVTNLRNPNPHSDKRNLMIMYDPSKGEYTTNPYRVHLAKYDTRLVNRWHMRLRFISNGQEANTGIDLYEWDPSRVYNFRMEWGAFPQIVSTQRVRVLLDGREIMTRNYDPIYRPDPHWVELGMAPRAESLEQAIYSNVRIGVRQP